MLPPGRTGEDVRELMVVMGSFRQWMTHSGISLRGTSFMGKSLSLNVVAD